MNYARIRKFGFLFLSFWSIGSQLVLFFNGCGCVPMKESYITLSDICTNCLGFITNLLNKFQVVLYASLHLAHHIFWFWWPKRKWLFQDNSCPLIYVGIHCMKWNIKYPPSEDPTSLTLWWWWWCESLNWYWDKEPAIEPGGRRLLKGVHVGRGLNILLTCTC